MRRSTIQSAMLPREDRQRPLCQWSQYPGREYRRYRRYRNPPPYRTTPQFPTGQQAAYRAYQSYIQDPINGRNGDAEDLLPGLEDLTPNQVKGFPDLHLSNLRFQVFWLSYGFSWCSKKSEKSLVSQLETDPHAPSICRVNQVMQDIPQFGRDFKCKWVWKWRSHNEESESWLVSSQQTAKWRVYVWRDRFFILTQLFGIICGHIFNLESELSFKI